MKDRGTGTSSEYYNRFRSAISPIPGPMDWSTSLEPISSGNHVQKWKANAMGEPRLISITKTPKLDEWGNVEYVVCAGTDITELLLKPGIHETIRSGILYFVK